jgi:hypothetical protein
LCCAGWSSDVVAYIEALTDQTNAFDVSFMEQVLLSQNWLGTGFKQTFVGFVGFISIPALFRASSASAFTRANARVANSWASIITHI